MAVFVTPISQDIIVSPYFQNNFEFGAGTKDDVRICRYLNKILKIFGNDIIVTGGRVSDISIAGNVITITVNSGRLIQDLTLIEFDQFSLDKDISSYGSNKIVVIYTDFQYTSADRDVPTDPCTFFFWIGVLDKNTHQVDGITWDVNKHRMIIAAYDLDESKQVESVNVDGSTYHVLGIDTDYNYFDLIDGGLLS